MKEEIKQLLEYIKKRENKPLEQHGYLSFVEKHPNLPLYVSIIALAVSIIVPIARVFLCQMT